MIFANPFARIVVGYDGSGPADAALDEALVLAEQYGGAIAAVHCSDLSAAAIVPIRTAAARTELDPAPLLASLDPFRHELFAKLADRVAARAIPVSLELATNAAAAGILDAAARWDATAIVVGTHSRSGFARAYSGSVAEEVVRAASLPVVVVREGATAAPLRRVVVGVDSSEPSATASVFAASLALTHPVRLVYCSVIDTRSLTRPIADVPFDPTPLLREMRLAARDALDAALQYAIASDVYADTEVTDALDPASGIAGVARRQAADAVVVGTHRRGRLERFFLGSTAEAVMHGCDQPVIVVPADAPIIEEQAPAAAAGA